MFNLHKMFSKNGYSNNFFNDILNYFVCSSAARHPDLLNIDENSQGNTSSNDIVPFQAFISIPYYSLCSVKFAKSIRKIMWDRFNIELRLVYSTIKVGNLFHL